MSIFAVAIDALFADPNLAVDAFYRVGGIDPAVPVRAILRRPDRVGEFGESRIAVVTTRFDLRVAEVATPAGGDTLDVSGVTYVVQGEPMRDGERLVWSIEARPVKRHGKLTLWRH